MLGNERVSHFASLTEYAVVFLDVALLADPSQFVLQSPYLGVLAIADGRLRELLLPRVERMRTHTQALRSLRNRITLLGDLRHRVPFVSNISAYEPNWRVP